jgi:hypothetical protein
MASVTIWKAQADACDDCSALDSKETSIRPPLHPNCRCELVHSTEKSVDIQKQIGWLSGEGYPPDKALATIFKSHLKAKATEYQAAAATAQDPDFKELLKSIAMKRASNIEKLEKWINTHR